MSAWGSPAYRIWVVGGLIGVVGVSVRIEMLASDYETRVAERARSFSVKSDRGKLKPTGDAPAGIEKALEPLRADPRWRGVEVEGGSEGMAD